MNFRPTVRGIFAAFFLFSVSAAAATIKVKGGTVHEGKLHGMIVLKGSEKEVQSDADPSKIIYSASYTVLNGSDITAVDEKGVHAGSGKPAGLFDVTQEGDTLDDSDVVRTGLKIPAGSPYGSTKKAGTVTRIDNRAPANPSRDAVLGEYRENELRPVIEIETAKGVVKVPVEDLVQVAAE